MARDIHAIMGVGDEFELDLNNGQLYLYIVVSVDPSGVMATYSGSSRPLVVHVPKGTINASGKLLGVKGKTVEVLY